jgi:hypothetical protein
MEFNMSNDTTRPASPRRPVINEEPEIAFEESIPLDGTDPVGEKMIDELDENKPDRTEPKKEPPPEPMPEQLPVS